MEVTLIVPGQRPNPACWSVAVTMHSCRNGKRYLMPGVQRDRSLVDVGASIHQVTHQSQPAGPMFA